MLLNPTIGRFVSCISKLEALVTHDKTVKAAKFLALLTVLAVAAFFLVGYGLTRLTLNTARHLWNSRGETPRIDATLEALSDLGGDLSQSWAYTKVATRATKMALGETLHTWRTILSTWHQVARNATLKARLCYVTLVSIWLGNLR